MMPHPLTHLHGRVTAAIRHGAILFAPAPDGAGRLSCGPYRPAVTTGERYLVTGPRPADGLDQTFARPEAAAETWCASVGSFAALTAVTKWEREQPA